MLSWEGGMDYGDYTGTLVGIRLTDRLSVCLAVCPYVCLSVCMYVRTEMFGRLRHAEIGSVMFHLFKKSPNDAIPFEPISLWSRIQNLLLLWFLIANPNAEVISY